MKEAEERMMQQQREEYGRRGIHLSYFEKATTLPYFINLDEDPFRSHRFMYLLGKVRGYFVLLSLFPVFFFLRFSSSRDVL